MNAIEMEEALGILVTKEFERDTFPFEFLEAFNVPAATVKRLRSGSANDSDCDGVLVRNLVHLRVVESEDALIPAVNALKESAATAKWKVRIVLATDGQRVMGEDLRSHELLDVPHEELHTRFGFLMPIGGIEMLQFEAEASIDIKASRYLNSLYMELQRHNQDWGGEGRAEKMNIFLARLIFCLFAEDTQIFSGKDLFSSTVEQFSNVDGSNMHIVIQTIFRAFDIPPNARRDVNLPSWTWDFPYVNGHLFAGDVDVPHFSRPARRFLLRIANLDWAEINPDIFGSMIQAIVDPNERSQLGMHYTSVPNILKVLQPLFLDKLHHALDDAGTDARKLRALRRRLSRIRILDPACGSGNFLVIAYKELRELEAHINARLGELAEESVIDLKNFRGIELLAFPALIARVSLIITKYQCDVRHLGQQSALLEFLPLDAEHWIVTGNALRLDWREIVPPSGHHARLIATDKDLFSDENVSATPMSGYDNEGGEVYICGNPPYVGSTYQSKSQKEGLKHVFGGRLRTFASLDYVAAWFMLAVDYAEADFAFVTTNSICQGQSVATLWPTLMAQGHRIHFAYPSFKWSNLASKNAGVTVSIIGLSTRHRGPVSLYESDGKDGVQRRHCENINGYLIAAPNVVVAARSQAISDLPMMDYGNKPTDGGYLLLTYEEAQKVLDSIQVVDYTRHSTLDTRHSTLDSEQCCAFIPPIDCTAHLRLA